MDTKCHKHCPVCHSKKWHELALFENSHLVKCNNCQMVFSVKIPTGDELTEHYKYYNRGRHVSDLTLKKYKSLLSEFKPYSKNKRVLDVGCGSGFFLEVAKELNWKPYGTEYGEESVEFCKKKGLNVVEGDILNATFQNNSFDVITSFEVIEHISFPLEHLTKLFDLLSPGGILYITTPNFNALTRYILKDKWTIVAYPEHLSYFSAHTLDYALKAVGFKREKMIADGISVDRLRNSFHKKKIVSENVAPDQAPKKKFITNESVRQASEKNPLFRALRKSIDWGLNTSRKGEFLKGYYIKPE